MTARTTRQHFTTLARLDAPAGTADHHRSRPAKRQLGRPALYGLFALTFVVAACGSSSSDSSKTTAAPGDTKAASADANGTNAGGGESAGGTGKGTIQVGDIKHDLDVIGCVTMSGALNGEAASVSEPDNISVSFEFSPEDWKSRADSEGWETDGAVRLDSEDPYVQWESGESVAEMYNLPDGLEAADVSIISYDVSDDGQSVSGEANFIEVTAMGVTNPDVVKGTFSFSCPPKG